MESTKLFNKLANSKVHFGVEKKSIFFVGTSNGKELSSEISDEQAEIIAYLQHHQLLQWPKSLSDQFTGMSKGGGGLDFLFVEQDFAELSTELYRSFMTPYEKTQATFVHYISVLLALFIRYTDSDAMVWTIACNGKELTLDTSKWSTQSTFAELAKDFTALLQDVHSMMETIESVNLALHDYESKSVLLAIHLSLNNDNVWGMVKYHSQLIAGNTIDRIVDHYCIFCQRAIANLEQPIASYSYLSTSEISQLKRWGGSKARYVLNRTIYDLFEQQANETPNEIAVIYEDGSDNIAYISYLDLLYSVDNLAQKLSVNGTKQVIGYYGERSIYTVIAMLAVWKSGNIYVPFDISYSEEHLQFILDDAQVQTIITTEQHVKKVSCGKSIVMDSSYLIEAAYSKTKLTASKSLLDQDCLIMYTSGSTGKPKGVIHKQLQLLNRFNWLWSKYPFKSTSCMGQRTSMNFMPSMWELLGGLLKGVPTVIMADAIVKDPNLLNRAIARHQITHLTVVPSLLKRMLEDRAAKANLSTLELCITAGEPLTVELWQNFREIVHNSILLNDFGATEVNGILYADSRSNIDKPDRLPGFKPIRNIKVYILDSNLNFTGIGVPGELYVGGVALATGYLHDEESNRSKFINNPFSDNAGSRLYKMGDYARYLPDGTIELLGRRDNQVKIRGVKLELTGIEQTIEQHAAIHESAVFVKEIRQGVSRLYAAIVLKEGHTVTDEQLYQFLKAKLSEYMIPSAFIRVDQLPRTPNGKIARQALQSLTEAVSLAPAQQRSQIAQAQQSSQIVSEQEIKDKLIFLASQTLAVDSSLIESHKKFYALGFDSLTIVDFLNAVKKVFGIELAVTDLYDHASLDELTIFLQANDSSHTNSCKAVNNAAFQPDQAVFYGAETSNEVLSKAETDHLVVMQHQLAIIAADVLRIDRAYIEYEKKYYALGFDSLTIVDFLNEVNRQFTTDLIVSDLYDYASIAELSEFLITVKKVLPQQEINQVSTDKKQEITEQSAPFATEIVEHEKSQNPIAANLQFKTEAVKENHLKKIAIIGLSCKFGGANNADEYWQNLKNGVDSVKLVPEHRWSVEKYYDPDMKADYKTTSKWGAFIENIDRFDGDFFSLTPIESENMDPQQRICLEECYHALEDAGYSESELSNKKVGVFIGARPGDYNNLIRENGHAPGPYSLLGNDFAILAARVAYFLNLKGPAISIDTACSSSLVAIHLAAESLLKGECEMAIAGGVSIMSTPDLYLTSTKLGMLSPDGKCKAFDNRANGFVPGEGVGIVVLKELEQAIADQDQIYGVITASGVNQDGKTNGITAPSALSQLELLQSIYEENGIDPASIDYVETHGTGTKLGDPIEIKALSEAFGKHVLPKQACPIGSVKTNIGHTIAAAGVAGLIKVLLSMKHEAIPPTLHFEQANEHIDFANSPFYVNTQLQAWHKKPMPRRAAVSSFGFSGTNCHLVVEDYVANSPVTVTEEPYYLIPLSAKSKNALKEKIEQLASWLEGASNFTLHDIAFTLSVRRNHFDERCAFVVANKEQLAAELNRALRHHLIDSIAATKAGASSDTLLTQLTEDSVATTEYMQRLEELKACYIRGEQINWRKLYEHRPNQMLSLPGYPFERRRYWIEPAYKTSSTLPKHGQPSFFDSVIREGQTVHYTINLTKQNRLIQDHIINGEVIVPAAFYLEMIMRAVQMQHIVTGTFVIEQLSLLHPIKLSEHAISITLSLDVSSLQFVICSGDVDVVKGAVSSVASSNVDELSLQSFDPERFIHNAPTSCNKHDIYSRHLKLGCQYGYSYQVVDSVHITSNGHKLLAALNGTAVSAVEVDTLLYPILLDGAFHAVIGSELLGSTEQLYLPQSIGKFHLYRANVAPCWSQIEIVEQHDINQFIKCHITLYGGDGLAIAQINDFVLKAVPNSAPQQLIYTPQWVARAISENSLTGQETVILFDRDEVTYEKLRKNHPTHQFILVLPGTHFTVNHPIYQIDFHSERDYAALFEHFTAHGIDYRYLLVIPYFAERSTSPLIRAEQAVHPMFALCKAIVKKVGNQSIHLLAVLDAGLYEYYPYVAALAPMLQSISMEKPNLSLRTLTHEWPQLDSSKVLLELFHETSATEVKYEGSVRMEKELHEVELENDQDGTDFNGVYLITGGLGGIGQAVARWFKRYPHAYTVLLGRAEYDENVAQILASLSAERVAYESCDLGDENNVRQVISRIRQHYGPIKGVFHCAGVIRDRLFIHKEWNDYEQVMRAKIAGTVYLHRYIEQADFIVYFSSVTSSFGNRGQADYAYANGFLDHFANYCSEMAQHEPRISKTISINWPLWNSGGMQLSDVEKERLKAEKGWVGIPDEVGLNALSTILQSGLTNVGVLYGSLAKLRQQLRNTALPVPTSELRHAKTSVQPSGLNQAGQPQYNIAAQPQTKAKEWQLSRVNQATLDRAAVKQEIANIIATVTKMSSAQVISKKSFEQFDFNSLMIMEMTRLLEDMVGRLPSTLFYEYHTLDELVDYMVESHREALLAKFSSNEASTYDGQAELLASSLEQLSTYPNPSNEIPNEVSSHSAKRVEKEEPNNRREDIAIIGIAGRYSGARDLDALWSMLLNGESGISEIPLERWDWKFNYTTDKKAYGGIYTKWGGFISDVDKFDPLFFGISPREAERMDPQERLFLEIAYASIEDAGYTPDKLCPSGKVGVFVGAMNADYGTGASFWSIANRVSYVLNFHGPSLAVDTACSSSLTAIHLAVESLQNGTSYCAIAGGVNLILDSYHYERLCGHTMLSSGNKCKAFGKDADGFVDGEGVGAVVLKPLSAAERDGDHIYGVIKATMINAGGRTNGYTVPNPNLQRELISETLRRANIDPVTISYVEAHGTGTELGDPIEIAGLTGAFTEQTNKRQYCAIGSIKTNIGHCESAAGIAGLTKVLLQMKHKTLVPSLHSRELNPRIDFINTPFIVQQEATEWKQPIVGETSYPRRAGLSSFGAGGANAHLIVEEYIPVEQNSKHWHSSYNSPWIIVLSAKSEVQLRQQAANLLWWLNRNEVNERELTSISYTLQVGRVAHEERLAMLINSVEQLKSKLTSYIEQGDEDQAVYRGHVTGEQSLGAMFGSDEDILLAIQAWINKGKYDKLLNLWVTGFDIDWNSLYSVQKPKRISLPTYPFARERYWLTNEKNNNGGVPADKDSQLMAAIHPLLHRNTSNLDKQRFSSLFTGREFFLRDHIVQGERMLPGAAYMEMSHSALRQSAPWLNENKIRLKQMMWLKPYTIQSTSAELHIDLYPENEREIEFEIYSEDDLQSSDGIIHCQGKAIFIPEEAISISKIDILALQAECSKQIISGQQCYQQFEAMGIEYGPAHQAIECLYIGSEKLLAKLSLPEIIGSTLDDYVLHPSLLDSAIQSVIGFNIGSNSFIDDNSSSLALPFAVEEMLIFGSCSKQMWAFVRASENVTNEDSIKKYDIDLYDQDGTLQISMRKFAFRARETEREVKAYVGSKRG